MQPVHDAAALLALHVALERGLGSRAALLGLLAHAEPLSRSAVAEQVPRLERAGWEEAVERLLSASHGEAGLALARLERLDPDLSRLARTPLGRVRPRRYLDFAPVGGGAMGVVYAAHDAELRRRVAFKILRTAPAGALGEPTQHSPFDIEPPTSSAGTGTSAEDLLHRFVQEARITGRLQHPGIVPVYELGETEAGVPYYTMRLIGDPKAGLATWADRLREIQGESLDVRLRQLEPFLRLCDTVAYAHAQGVLHRDIKPENVALGPFGEVVLLDWGLAKESPAKSEEGAAAHDTERPGPGPVTGGYRHTVATMLGTPGYLPPEAVGERVAGMDAASDVFSLGVILHEILTGAQPVPVDPVATYLQRLEGWGGPHLEDFPADVPAGLAEVCRRALDPDQRLRTGTAQALAEGVRRWQTESATARERRERVRRAAEALTDAGGREAARRLEQVERAAGALEAARQLSGEETPEERELTESVQRLRALGLSEVQREATRRARRRLLTWAAALALLALVAWLGTVLRDHIEEWSRRARSAEREALAAREAAQAEALAGEDAVRALEQVLRSFPVAAVRTRALVGLGKRLWDLDRHEGAIYWGGEALWLEPPTPEPADPARLATRALLERGDVEVARAIVDRAMAGPLAAEERPEFSLLRAEVLGATGHLGPARRALAEVREAAGPLGARAALVGLALEHLRPVRWVDDEPLPASEPRLRAHVAAGRYRAGEISLVTRGEDGLSVDIRPLTADFHLRPSRLRLSPRTQDAHFLTVDADGDGVDELLEVENTASVSPAEATGRRAPWWLWSLAGDSLRPVASGEVVLGSHAIGAGDLTGDGRPELAVASSYPSAALHLFTPAEPPGRGSSALAPLRLEGLAPLEPDNHNVRHVALLDLDGDGRCELLYACSEWSFVGLAAYRWVPDPGRLERIPVDSGPQGRTPGWVADGVVVPAGAGSRAQALCFTTSATTWVRAREAAHQFLPLGLYEARYDASAGVVRIVSRRVHRPLEIGRTPTELRERAHRSGERLVSLRAGGRRLVVVVGRTLVGWSAATPWLALHDLDDPEGAPFVCRLPSPVRVAWAYDVDADGLDELITLDEQGAWRVWSASGEPEPEPAAPEPQEPTREPLGCWNELLDLLRSLGWTGQVERLLRERASGAQAPVTVGPAFETLVDTALFQTEFTRALALLDAGPGPGGEASRRRDLWRAEVLDRLQRYPEAAAAYARVERTGLAWRDARAAARRASELAPWRQARAVELPAAPGWAVRGTGLLTVDGRTLTCWLTGKADAELVASGVDGLERGFRLKFRLRLGRLAYAHVLQIGGLEALRGRRSALVPGLCVSVETSSQMACLLRLGNPAAPESLLEDGSGQARTLEERVDYSGVLTWEPAGRRLGVTFTRAGADDPEIGLQAHLPYGGVPSGQSLGVRLATDGYAGTTQATIELLELTRLP